MPKGYSIRLRLLAAAALLGCLGAAAASAAATHPDFSGVWGPYVEPGQPSVRALRARMKLPLTPTAQRKVDEYRALVTPGDDNPGKFCLGYGMPESMVFSGGYPMEIVQRPDEILIVYEAYGELRHIYFGSRVSAPGDRIPDRDGYSTGRWEGDTLVVDTTSLKEQEDQLYPHSDQAHIIERYRLTRDAKGERVLVDDWTLTDPSFYVTTVKAEKKWGRDPTQVFLPYECNEEGWLDHLEALRKSKDAALPPVY
ncbi:MAG TPA: hypothetical protein VMU67_03835 [Steroidobacteraceae bacterium]|nr:hypothetical protein [Steroidobacteraceae bacterium]